MITVTVYQHSGQYKGFCCEGHAGYADAGYDIICAAVSVLTINAINSIEEFTEDHLTADGGADGYIKLTLDSEVSDYTKLLLDSMILGLKQIQQSYGNEYIDITFKEV
ncbi:MAG: ribosomal-processing cysteine protease Prp [Marvinbryantia sp.]|jgi:uncharacterized protein YsxB (DUF464 family)